MKIWLDDERDLELFAKSEGYDYLKVGVWTQVYNSQDAKKLILELIDNGETLTAISFDNDLGYASEEEGYDVFKLIEELVMTGKMELPQIFIHTANPEQARRIHLSAVRLMQRINNK